MPLCKEGLSIAAKDISIIPRHYLLRAISMRK